VPTTYQNIMGGRSNLTGVPFNTDTPTPCRGTQFLNHCNGNGIGPGINMATLTNTFHDFLAGVGGIPGGGNWTWSPGAPGNGYTAGARLLDGTANAGECAFVPFALAYLINAPAPWGFGVGGATVDSYSGANHIGFIAAHNNALPGPLPNITQAAGGVLPNFYLWGNHKVVTFGGVHYDVCYRTTYAALANMAAVDLQLTRNNVRLRDLEDYDYKKLDSLWELIKLKFDDLLRSTTHTIEVLQATAAHAVLTGGNPTAYFISWVENRPHSGASNYYGPYQQNPLVR
jgi:hypothetical protein